MTDSRRRQAGGAGARQTFSGTTFAGWYFLVQAIAFSGWWAYLFLDRDAVQLFVPPGAGPADLRAFQAPDLLVAVQSAFVHGMSLMLLVSGAIAATLAVVAAVGMRCPSTARHSARRRPPDFVDERQSSYAGR